MKQALLATATVIALTGSVSAQLYGETARPNLATECTPMGLSVHVNVSEPLRDIENEQLNTTIQNLTESRLRTARIYDEDGWDNVWQYLAVSINGISSAINLDIFLYRAIWNSGYGELGTVIVYGSSVVMANPSTSFIRDNVTDIVEEFIVEYLRANPEC